MSHKINAITLARIKAAQKARWAKIKASKAQEVEVLPPVKVANNATLKNGNDAAIAKKLTKLFADAQNGMRKVVALGLFAWEVKLSQLKHGEFGPWLAQHCPKLATTHSATGKPMASRALSGYMDLTKSVLENCGCPSIEKYLDTTAKSANDADLGHGKFLLIADKKVPESLRPMREKIFELVDGKTQRALFSEFKQAEDTADENVKVKRGRLPGSSGLTADMRALAAQREEEERQSSLATETAETTTWLLTNADAKNAGMVDMPLLAKLQEACQTMSGFIGRLIEARKGAVQTSEGDAQ